MYLLNQARMNGIHLERARIARVNKIKNNIASVTLSSGETIFTTQFINAAGPYLRQVGEMLDDELPVYCELHQKAAFRDHMRAIPREAPLLIWNDPQHIDWSDEEREYLTEQQDSRWMLDELPSGPHTRPEGGIDSQIVLMLWEYKAEKKEPAWPPYLDPLYPELALRGLVKMLPHLKNYEGKLPRFTLDGGYYTKTRENRPLIGPQSTRGSYIIGALSGYGLMAACAAGELIAACVAKSPLPDYAPSFNLDRYADHQYLSLLAQWGDTGQL
jgi:glycine/D-amino acid oxidase-like deaminating enzyme